MARQFDGTDDYVQTANNAVSGMNVDVQSAFGWVNADDNSATQCMFTLNRNLAGGVWLTGIRKRIDGIYDFIKRFTGPDGIWTFGTISFGSWLTLSADLDASSDANDPNCYVDGTLEVETENTTPIGNRETGEDTLQVGVLGNQVQDWDGAIAHVAVWSAALSANEHGALSRGVPPFIIRNSDLQWYSPLHGNLDPEPDYAQQANGNVTDATKATTNPPVELLENFL